jgi:hypothetical protein
MSDYKDILERIGAHVEMPEPALDRMVRRKDRRHRNRRLAAAGLGLGLTAVLLITLVNGYTRSQGVVVTTPSPTVPDRVVRQDALPPDGSVPTPGGVGSLVYSYSASGPNGSIQYLFLYEDGRLITSNSPIPDHNQRWVERRLTPEGVSYVRDAISRDLEAVAALPRSEPVEAPGSRWYNRLRIGPGTRPGLAWGPRAHTGKTDVVANPTETATLERLRERLTDPIGWLPAAAWAQVNPVPFVPRSYLVTVNRIPSDFFTWKWLYRQGELDDLQVPTGMQLPDVGGCETVDLATARQLASLFDEEGRRFSNRTLGNPLVWPKLSGDELVNVGIWFPLPHESCEHRYQR